MEFGAMSFLLYGILLTAVFAGLIIYYFSSKRKDKVEEAKYRMLEDDEQETEDKK